jgi:amino acid adenylation domain-containing protein
MVVMNIGASTLCDAEQHGGRVAFTAEGTETSYAELAATARALGSALAARLSPGDRVAICAAKSPAAIAAMLAATAVGLAYVPIDPRDPSARREYIVARSGARLVLSDATTDAALRSQPLGAAVVPLDALTGAAAARTTASWDVAATDADTPACVLFTSGSTGAPKGVVITHRNIDAFVRFMARRFPLGVDDRVAVVTPLHFDLATYDIYVGLSAGATLCLVDDGSVMFPESLVALIAREHITAVYAVPSTLAGLADRPSSGERLASLRRVLYAGEEYPLPSLARLMAVAPRARVFNLYGPVETNVVTWYEARAPLSGRVPIGRPADHALVALLGEDGAPVRYPGVVGELVVAGPSVTPGYLGDTDRSRTAFVDVDLDGKGRVRCYRTGDFAAYDDEGLLHFHGRKDHMVKVRGHRVELSEVDVALEGHPAVARAAAVYVPGGPDASGDGAVQAFVTLRNDQEVDSAGLVRHCRDHLPPYMTPRHVWVCPELPTTSTGKVDRVALTARARSALR